MLKLEDFHLKSEKDGKKKDFQAFQNPKIPYLRLVKYKGIGLGKENDVTTITNQTINYIKKQNNKGSYNDFVHCIWYCVSGQRMEELEDEYLMKLRNSYSNVDMPIILIYLNESNKTKINSMKEKIKKILDVDFINVISKTIKRPNNGGTINPRGENELMNLTLEKCRVALKGDMPKIMMKNISNEILFNMKSLVETNKCKIKDIIKEKFINEFKYVQKDKELINYIVTLLGRNLSIFYEKNISNNSLNLIVNSEIISNVTTFMNNCKQFTKNLTSSYIISNANDFIDKQASLEKINKENINIENKRTIKGFKKTNEIFFKKNFYYISQKYIINNLILYYCKDYLNEFQKQFNDIIVNLINQNENSEINKYIAICFGAKLKKFGEKMNVNFETEKYEKYIGLLKEDSLNPYLKNEKLIIEIENEGDNSFDINYEEGEELDFDNIEEKIEVIVYDYLSKTFKFKNDWKYLKKESSQNLINFLINFKFIDTSNNYFKRNNFFNNALLNSLKGYEKNNLELYLNNNLKQFLYDIDNNIKNINNRYELINNNEKIIKEILTNEGIEKILLYKIKREFEGFEKDNQFKKIDYLTIIITGRTGVGKSSLINALLKENLAFENMKEIGTTKPTKYENKKVPFLKLIDTRGIEMKEEHRVNNISEEIIKIVNNPNELDKYKEQKNDNLNFINSQKGINYNDYVQCVWYCVTGSSLEPEEIEFIKKIQMQKNKVPVVIVYTISEDEEKMEKMKCQIMKDFNAIPYVEVLAKDDDTDNTRSFGLDTLLYKTIEQCKNAFGSRTFEEIKKEINQEIIINLKKKNSSITYSVNNESISYFIHNFDKVILKNNQFKEYLYYLFAILFNGHLKKENEPEVIKHLLETIAREFKTSNISKYINEIIQCYNDIAKKFIDTIKYEKAIQFLDKQAIYEKKNNNLEIKDKCNINDFMEIIESFLKNNFYNLAQKFFIYHTFINIIERFSEKIENEINQNLISILLNNSRIFYMFTNIYKKKIEDLNRIIIDFLNKENYHKSNNNDNGIIRKDDIINLDRIDELNLIDKGEETLYNNDDSLFI